MTLVDFLVGAVSMPLTTTLDTLVLQRVLVVDLICTMYLLIPLCCKLFTTRHFLDLLLIAWERYVAIAKSMEYKAIVTETVYNKYARVARLLAVIIVLLVAVSVRFEFILDIITSIIWFVCLSLIAYFYVKAYPLLLRLIGCRHYANKKSKPGESATV